MNLAKLSTAFGWFGYRAVRMHMPLLFVLLSIIYLTFVAVVEAPSRQKLLFYFCSYKPLKFAPKLKLDQLAVVQAEAVLSFIYFLENVCVILVKTNLS